MTQGIWLLLTTYHCLMKVNLANDGLQLRGLLRKTVSSERPVPAPKPCLGTSRTSVLMGRPLLMLPTKTLRAILPRARESAMTNSTLPKLLPISIPVPARNWSLSELPLPPRPTCWSKKIRLLQAMGQITVLTPLICAVRATSPILHRSHLPWISPTPLAYVKRWITR